MESNAAPSALGALSSALLGCPLTTRQLGVLASLLRSRPAQERLALPVLVYLLDVWTLTRRPRARFRHLPSADQARWIARWLDALPRVLRRGLAGLKSLAALAVYDDRQSWSRTGYDGPWLGRVSVAVLPELAPSVQAASGDLSADVCVIGSGAGGASAAARLAERGLQVIVLEAGPRISAADCTQRELDMMAMLYAERGLAGTIDQSITILRGRGLGGSTLHNTGLVVRPPRGVIERWRAEHGFAVPDATLELHVQRVMTALRAVPIPESRVNTANQLLRSGADALGWRHQVPNHNRVECSGCGYCMIGCAYNRKVNAAGAFLQSAAAQGTTLLTDVYVQSFERAGGIFSVHARDSNGAALRVRARRVVLAAGALETPLLLRRSGVEAAPVGRRLRLHPAPVVFARFDQRVEAWRGLPQAVMVTEFASFEQDGRGGFLLLANAGTAPALTAAVSPAFGEHHANFMSHYPHLASAAVLLHDESTGVVRAARGRAAVRYWPDAGDRREMLRGVGALAELYFAAGAREVYLPFEPGRARRAGELEQAMSAARIRAHGLPLTSVHPQGTCAMGMDSYRSVVRTTGEVWEAPGVFVADASIFPTSIGVPPQVTIMALAGLIADHVANELNA